MLNTLMTTPFSSPLGWMLSLERQLDAALGATPRAPQRPQLEADEAGYTLRAALPGLPKEALEITVDDGLLQLKATAPEAPEGYTLRHQERRPLAFRRRLRLPEDVDPEAIGAELKDGLLTVRLPRQARPEPRKIEVKLS